MPLTLFAHQVPTLGLKIARPRWFDGTALCIGSMTPDLVTGLGAGHSWWPNMPAAWLLGVVITVIVRTSLASVAAAQLPDLGPFRLHSWRVLARGRHTWTATAVAVAVGLSTHHILDSFTHPSGGAARLFGYDDIEVVLFGVASPLASVFQWVGHSLGSMTAIWMLLAIGSHRRLEEWYGVDAVAAERSFRLSARGRQLFWSLSTLGAIVGTGAAVTSDARTAAARIMLTTFVAMTVAAQIPACRPDAVVTTIAPAAQPYDAQR